MMNVMAPAHMKIKAGSRAMLVSLLRLLNVSFSDQAQIPIARIPNPRSWIQRRHEKLSHTIQVTHPKDDIESEDDIFEATGHLTSVPDPPPPLLVLRVVARRHLRTPLSPGSLSYLYRILSTSAK